MPDLAGDASRRVANTQAKYLYWILGVLGGTPAVLIAFTDPHRWAILGVAAVAGVWLCRYGAPLSVRLGPETMVVHWPLRSVMVDADSLRLARQSPTLAGRDTIAFRVHGAASFNLVLNQFEDPSEMLATIIRLVEAAPSFTGDRERAVSTLRRLG
ncbi:MAG: hypothetical protein HHJ13_00120 [Phycicoccus sp.]|nr:hypothetical protein [Phycicoccus sp.]